jgi:hypothetical protein
MGDYFGLEVFAHEVILYEHAALPFLSPTSAVPSQTSRLPGCCALSFQFLDYPLLMVYSSTEEPQWAIAAGLNAQLHQFGSGKSCVVQADREELQFLLDEVSFGNRRLPNLLPT